MIISVFKHIVLAIGYGLLGALLILVGVYIYWLESRPDLSVWHEADLDAEFRVEQAAEITALADYLQLEERLFQQLQEQVYARIKPSEQRQVNRYFSGSLTDPSHYPVNGNRTFELIPEYPVGAALLLHGLSDSPYSLRVLGERLYAQDIWVLGLRLPGHGTAPAGLLNASWQDAAAAVKIGVRHLRASIAADQPLYLVGYSNGAALAIDYTVTTLEDAALPRVSRLVLLSPAVGVPGVAALAIWQARLGQLLGLEKMAWNSIEPEFDPYKYNSFSVNAADQVNRLTHRINERITQLAEADGLSEFPPVLAFQSVVDATISPVALVRDFLAKLPAAAGNQLVLFDINRHAEAEPLLRHDSEEEVQALFAQSQLPFALTLITNADATSTRVIALNKDAVTNEVSEQQLPLSWPEDIFSLSHVALPFPAQDPIYGQAPDPEHGRRLLTLGSIVVRGERGLLQIPDNTFMRLRYNPFFSYLAERMLAFLGLDDEAP